MKKEELVKLQGIIKNYQCTRAEACFVFTETEKHRMGVVAIAAAVAGLSGPAISTASNTSSIEEEADYVEFDLNGNQIKGWVWRSPFKEGDRVIVAAEWRNDHYEAAGIARPSDRIIALYPHCSRGISRHLKKVTAWWVFGVGLFLLLQLLLMLIVGGADTVFEMLSSGFHFVAIACYAFFGLMTFSLARKWMPFVRLAEKVFRTLGSSDPESVDLVKSSKSQRKPEDPGELGTFYFRY